MRLTTPHEGREISVTDEVQADMGRVVYRVEGVGAFTIEREAYGYPKDRRSIECTYGVLTGPRRFYARGALPEAPVMFGITIGGGAVFSEDRFTEITDEDGRRRWWSSLPMQRATETDTRGSVPDRTGHRITDIVGALALHYLARPDRPDIEHAQAVRLAPQRLNTHQRDIDRLREQIADLQANLATEIALADTQVALLTPHVEATLSA